MDTVLVTGGAGYVGSHTVKLLRERGIPTVVLDNLVRGHREFVSGVPLVEADTGDAQALDEIFSHRRVGAVMHFAAFAYVGESVTEPLKYFRNNVATTVTLLERMVNAGVPRFIFSSSCSTYGLPERVPIDEDHPQRPVNPYGASKVMVERMLADLEAAHGVRSVVLRYFNAAGADPDGTIGERHDPETHLIPLALRAATDPDTPLRVYGTDYPTPDGTCIRDYIHVSDIAEAHVLALQRLLAGGTSDAFNLGNGNGCSVRDVVRTVEAIVGRTVPVIECPRRQGDPPMLVGSADKARRMLGWSPRFDRLEAIVETAWRWHRA